MKKFAKGVVCLGLAALLSASFAACTKPDVKDPDDGGENPPVVT